MDQKTKILSDIVFDERKTLRVPESTPFVSDENDKIVAMALKNIESLGFTIDQPGVECLRGSSRREVEEWYYDTVEKLTAAAGGDVKYTPFYPDFPDRYIDHNDVNAILDQIAHYWIGYRPDGVDAKENIQSLETHPIKVLRTVADYDLEKEATDIVNNLLASKMNLPVHEYNSVLKRYMEAVPDWSERINTVANRNTLCLLYYMAMSQKISTENMPKLVTNDYLRLAKIMGIAHHCKDGIPEILNVLEGIEYDFKQVKLNNLTNAEYRQLLTSLENNRQGSLEDKVANLEDDFKREKAAWKILLKNAHIKDPKKSSYFGRNKIPALWEASDALYNDKLRTFYSKVEAAYSEDLHEAIRLLSTRPGEFIKQLNRIIEKIYDTPLDPGIGKALKDYFYNTCEKVFNKCRPEDLFSVIEYLNAKMDNSPLLNYHRVNGTWYQGNRTYNYNVELCPAVIELAKSAIKDQLSTYNLITNRTAYSDKYIYIDPQLKDYAVPGKDRQESSASLNTYTKGSRISMEQDKQGNPKNPRLFIWWTNNNDDYPIDIDLSVKAFRGDFSESEPLGYYSTALTRLNCRHSGDITDGGPYNGSGATEFIDLDIDKLREAGYKYVQCTVNVYRGGSFSDLNCKFGWMEREELDRSRHFDINAVKQKSELSTNARCVIPVIFDVEKAQVIWLDVPESSVKECENQEKAADYAELLTYKYGSGYRMNMWDLAHLATEHTGCHYVTDPSMADIIISADEYKDRTDKQINITAKDQDEWLGRFMTPQSPVGVKNVELYRAFVDSMDKDASTSQIEAEFNKPQWKALRDELYPQKSRVELKKLKTFSEHER